MTVDELISALQDIKFEWEDSGYRMGEHQVVALNFSSADEIVTSVRVDVVSGNVHLVLGES